MTRSTTMTAGRSRGSSAIDTARPPIERDLRLDFFRGLALLFIFIDHVPGNSLSYWTLHAWGVADAAEVFVLIAGISAVMAYAARIEHHGLLSGSRPVLARTRDIYAAHLLLVAICAGGLAIAARYFENPLYFEHVNLTPLAYDPLAAIWRATTLLYQPGYINILPLYIVLLAVFPLIVWAASRRPMATLAVSIAIWIGAKHGLNLPSWPETIGWFFNPFAWQLLFTVGVVAGVMYRRGGSLPRSPWLIALAAGYTLLCLVAAAPWVNIPHLGLPRLIPLDMLPIISKSSLSAWRLANILAIAYLAAVVVPAGARWLRSRAAMLVVDCGRNSLDIFCLGTVLSFAGFVVLLEGGRTWPYQLAVNAIGMGVMLCTAAWLTRRKALRKQTARVQASTPLAGPIEPVVQSVSAAPSDTDRR